MNDIENDKKKYLALTLQKFLQDWSYLEKLLTHENCLNIYNTVKNMLDVPEINWRFNKIICSSFDDDRVFGVCDGIAFVPAIIELLVMIINNCDGYYFCKCSKILEKNCQTPIQPYYFIMYSHCNLKNESDKFNECARKALMRICENEKVNFDNVDFVVQCFPLTNILFNKLLDIVIDKENYNFNKIKCLTFKGFKDSEAFKCKIDKLFDEVKEKHNLYLKF